MAASLSPRPDRVSSTVDPDGSSSVPAARNTQASPGYVDRKTYTLGRDADGDPHTIAAANDAYKRHVFQTQVALPNPAGRRLP